MNINSLGNSQMCCDFPSDAMLAGGVPVCVVVNMMVEWSGNVVKLIYILCLCYVLLV